MRKDRLIKQLEKKKSILVKNNYFKQAYQVEKMLIQIKEKSFFSFTKNEPQKTLFFVEQQSLSKEITIKTKLRYCRSCNSLFPSPHNVPNPKCIMCKVRDGSLDEARRDLELYTISELNKK